MGSSHNISFKMERSELLKFFEKAKNDFEIFLPYESDFEGPDNLKFQKFDNNPEFILNKYRTIDPPKSLLYLPYETILPSNNNIPQRIIVGIKNCDLLCLGVLDAALIEDNFTEPNYKTWRDNTYIISTDCDDALETCHCNLLKHKPYPERKDDKQANFDLNLSVIAQESKKDEKYIITVGTKKGQDLIKLMTQYCNLEEATPSENEIVKSQHKKIEKKLEDINSEFNNDRNYQVIDKCKDEKVWKELCKECVQCAGCTNICPSCYCIIVNDESKDGEFKKVRTWDSCQLTGYAIVAGGATPRGKLWERFRNRYQCKYIFIRKNFSQYGCKGCGRCIAVCPAEIDLREVIKALQEV